MSFEKHIQVAVAIADIIICSLWPIAIIILGLLFIALLFLVIKE